MQLQSSVCQRIGNTASFFCQHSMLFFIKKGRSGSLGQNHRCLEFGSSLAQDGVRLREIDYEQYPVELLIQQGRCRLKGLDANSCHIIYYANCNKFITFVL